MKCPYCGFASPKGAPVCGACGKKPEFVRQPNETRPAAFYQLAVGALLMLGLFYDGPLAFGAIIVGLTAIMTGTITLLSPNHPNLMLRRSPGGKRQTKADVALLIIPIVFLAAILRLLMMKWLKQ
jgi:hypothetical protein